MFDHSLECLRNCETCSQRVRDGDKEESRVSSKVQLGQEWVDFGTHFTQSWASTENFGDLGSQTEPGTGAKKSARGPNFLPAMPPPNPPCHQNAPHVSAQPHIWPADPAGGNQASHTLSHLSSEGGCNAIITSCKSLAICSYLVKEVESREDVSVTCQRQNNGSANQTFRQCIHACPLRSSRVRPSDLNHKR